MSQEQYDEIGRRLKAADEAARARFPACCPNCHDDSDITPTFDDDIWLCGACEQPFEVKR